MTFAASLHQTSGYNVAPQANWCSRRLPGNLTGTNRYSPHLKIEMTSPFVIKPNFPNHIPPARPIAMLRLGLGLLAGFGWLMLASAQNFAVTGGNTVDYTINGQSDPGFTLQRGVTYVFELSNVSFHPFWIKSSSGFGGTGAFASGVVNNGGTSGNVSFTVPAEAPDTLFYQCGNHGSMLGVLTIVTPPTPPTVRIVHIEVGQFITLRSTGTNGWNAIPEFKCDAAAPAWSVVTPHTNTFNNGTNTTTFPRLETMCGSTNVLLRIRNQPN